MTDINTVALIGRLTRDAEVRTSQDGTSSYGTITIADVTALVNIILGKQ